MQRIILSEKYTLSFEPLGEKIRLILSEADIELVCRKETIKNLRNFILNDELKIFKGRLQLNKHKDIIEVIMKDKLIAIVSLSKLVHVLNNFENAIN